MALYRNVAGVSPGIGYAGLFDIADPGDGGSNYGGTTIDQYTYDQTLINRLRPDVTAPVITDPSTSQVLLLQPDATQAPTPVTIDQTQPAVVTPTGGVLPASQVYEQNIIDSLRNDTGGIPVLPSPSTVDHTGIVPTSTPITQTPLPLPVTQSHNPPTTQTTTTSVNWLPIAALSACIVIAVGGEHIIKRHAKIAVVGGVGLAYYLMMKK